MYVHLSEILVDYIDKRSSHSIIVTDILPVAMWRGKAGERERKADREEKKEKSREENVRLVFA